MMAASALQTWKVWFLGLVMAMLSFCVVPKPADAFMSFSDKGNAAVQQETRLVIKGAGIHNTMQQVQGSGFRVQGLGFMVWGLGF